MIYSAGNLILRILFSILKPDVDFREFIVPMDIVTVITLYNLALWAGIVAFIHLYFTSYEKSGLLQLIVSFAGIGVGSVFASLGEFQFLPLRLWTSISMILAVIGYSYLLTGFQALNYKRTNLAGKIMAVLLLIILVISFFTDYFLIDRIRAVSFHTMASLYMFLSGLEILSKYRIEKIRSRIILFLVLLFGSCIFLLGTIALLTKENYVPALARGFSLLMITHFLISVFTYGMVKERAEKRLQKAATIDALTGIGNRKWLQDTIPAIARNKDSILMLDIDKFKNINDTYGHFSGDEVLVTVVERIQKYIREGDLFARFGGEEFLIFIPGMNHKEISVFCERILLSVRNISFIGKLAGCSVTISIGICWNNGKFKTISEMMQKADEALYKAKENGRNRFEFH